MNGLRPQTETDARARVRRPSTAGAPSAARPAGRAAGRPPGRTVVLALLRALLRPALLRPALLAPALLAPALLLPVLLGPALRAAAPAPAAPQPQEPGAPARSRGEVQAIVVPIEGTIATPTVALFQRALREARAEGATRLVLSIDTPGGYEVAMRDVEAILASLSGEGVRTVAYVRHKAWSAGAYLALACPELVMAPGSSIGAITPVLEGPAGVQQIPDEDVRKKVYAAMRADVRSLVERRRDEPAASTLTVAEAMVDPTMEVWDVVYVDQAGVQVSTVVEQDELRKLEAQGGKIVRRQRLPSSPVVLSAEEAMRYGVATGVAGSLEELVREEFGLAMDQVRILEKSWSEDAVTWLDTMKPFLFVIGFILLLIELKTPGFAVPGVLGLLLLGLAMFSSYLVGLAEWTEILLFFLGLGLLGVEVFLIPGTIVVGLLGFACVVMALLLSQQTFILPSTAAEQDILIDNLLNMLFLLLLTIAAAVAFWRFLPRIPLFHRVILVPPQPATATASGERDGSLGFGAAEAPATAAATGDALLGSVGRAATDLRPAGIVELGDRRLDVLSVGSFVPRGTPVRVVQVLGNRVVVEAVDDAGAAGARGPAGGAASGEVGIALLILLVIVGFGLVVAEVFFVSFGILSVAAAVAMVSAIFLAFAHHGQTVGLVFLTMAAIGVPAILLWAFRMLPRTRIGQKIILAAPERSEVRAAAEEPGLEALLHQNGVAVSDLRPTGFARIAGRRVDVITRGELIDKDTPVRVIEIEGNRVVVATDRGAAPAAASSGSLSGSASGPASGSASPGAPRP